MSIENIPGGNYKCLMFYYYSHQTSGESSGVMGYLKVTEKIKDGAISEFLNVDFEKPEWLILKYNITASAGQTYSVRCFFSFL